jgi:predicted phosphoribosyltransferase
MWRVPIYVAIPVLAAAAYLALSYTADHFVYFPSKYPEGLWNAVLRASDVWLETADGAPELIVYAVRKGIVA